MFDLIPTLDLHAILDTTVLILAIPTGLALIASVIGSIFCWQRLGEYWLNLLVSFDQGINTLFGGKPDETISSASYRMGARIPPKSGWWWLAYRGINAIFFLQADHCRGAFNKEQSRGHLPSEFQPQEVSNAASNP